MAALAVLALACSGAVAQTDDTLPGSQAVDASGMPCTAHTLSSYRTACHSYTLTVACRH